VGDQVERDKTVIRGLIGTVGGTLHWFGGSRR
jgi:hypothetical protein